jgi:hypothetical protein
MRSHNSIMQGDGSNTELEAFLTDLRKPHGIGPDYGARSMSDFSSTILQNFDAAARGVRRTFVTRDSTGNDIIVRQLLYSCTRDLFVFVRDLSVNVFSASVVRNLATRRPSPSIRFLLQGGQGAEREAVLSQLEDLVRPSGPIEVRQTNASSSLDMIVVDARHLWIKQDSEHTIVDLNSASDARNALQRLDQLWDRSSALDRFPRSRLASETRVSNRVASI